MSKRKCNTSHLTQEQLEQIAAKYPQAVVTIRKPVYRIISMLLECGLEVPGMGEAKGGLPIKDYHETLNIDELKKGNIIAKDDEPPAICKQKKMDV